MPDRPRPLPTTNLLDYGFDSWKVVAVCKHVNFYSLEARSDLHSLVSHDIHEHPTIEGLKLALKRDNSLANGSGRCQEMQAVYDRCLLAIPKARITPRPRYVVLLTGSSGSLGSYMLS